MSLIKMNIAELATDVVLLLRSKGYTFATAESCTGGAIANAITRVAGCSDVMLGGVVAYSNNVKHAVLRVANETLSENGAVSEEVVREMVEGIAQKVGADCAVATSGIAGPGGGTPDKPVGTVWTAVKIADNVSACLLRIEDGGRDYNIDRTVYEVLLMLKRELMASL